VAGRALQHVPLVAALADEDTRRMLLIAHLPNISAGGEGRQTVWTHPGWLCGSLRGWPLRLACACERWRGSIARRADSCAQAAKKRAETPGGRSVPRRAAG